MFVLAMDSDFPLCSQPLEHTVSLPSSPLDDQAPSSSKSTPIPIYHRASTVIFDSQLHRLAGDDHVSLSHLTFSSARSFRESFKGAMETMRSSVPFVQEFDVFPFLPILRRKYTPALLLASGCPVTLRLA